MKNRIIGSIAALALLLAAGTGWFISSRNSLQSHGADTAALAREEVAVAENNKANSVAGQLTLSNNATTSSPESIAISHGSSVERARAGDLVVACQHAVQLKQCAIRAQALEAAKHMQGAMANGASNDDKAVTAVAALLNSSDRLAAQCDGVTSDMIRGAYELQKLASQRGGVYARWLAGNPALDQNNFVQDADRWAEYRNDAKSYFANALKAKQIEDLPLLLLVHYPSEILLPRPPYRSPDASKFLALYEAALRNGIAVPPEMAATANDLKAKQVLPDPSISGVWSGNAPRSVERGLNGAMFPDVASADFCR